VSAVPTDSLYDKRVDRFEADCWTLADFLIEAAQRLALERAQEKRRARAELGGDALGDALDEALEDTRHMLEAATALRILPLRFRECEDARRQGVQLDRPPESFVGERDLDHFRIATMARLTVSGALFTVSVLVGVMEDYVIAAPDDGISEALGLVPPRFFERLEALLDRIGRMRSLLASPAELDALVTRAKEGERRYQERAAHHPRGTVLAVETLDTSPP
jgi:hypothetical protein